MSNSGSVFSSSNLNYPVGLAFDSAGSLFVANYSNNVVKFTATGGVLASTSSIFTSSGVSNPYGLAFDSTGSLYLANDSNNTIEKYISTGGELSNIGTQFASSPDVNAPRFLAFTPTPEPGTAVGLLLGGAVLLARRRR